MEEKVYIGTQFIHGESGDYTESLTVNGLIARLEYLRDYENAGDMEVFAYNCSGYHGRPYFSKIETDDINIGYEHGFDGLVLKDLDY